jgi:hypothetical protein
MDTLTGSLIKIRNPDLYGYSMSYIHLHLYKQLKCHFKLIEFIESFKQSGERTIYQINMLIRHGQLLYPASKSDTTLLIPELLIIAVMIYPTGMT